jgi:hypothetical protein
LNSDTSKGFNLAAATVLSLGSVFAAVTTIVIPAIELGKGAESHPECISSAVVDFGTSLEGTLTNVTVSDVGSDCAGRWVKLSLYLSADGSGAAIEEIVWRIPEQSSPPVLTFTLLADGTTTGTSSTNIWPTSESGAAGLSATPIESSTVNSFLLETSDVSLTDGP